MPIKTVDVDIRHMKGFDGLKGYDAVDILFRSGRDPLGRARIPCKGTSIAMEKIFPFIENLPTPSMAKAPAGNLPSVTVAICTKNRPEQLAVALHSVAHQQYPADEILVIDNGCQCEVKELVKGVFSQARYLAERGPGLDFARNRAVEEASGDVLAFLDDDAEADPFWVRSMAECVATFPESGAVTGLTLPLELETPAQQLCEANGGFARGFTCRVLPIDRTSFLGFRLPIMVDTIGVGNGCNMAFRSDVLRELGGFDEALDRGTILPGGGDLDMFYRMVKAGKELIYYPRAMVRHRHRSSVEGLRCQLAGHQKALIALLVKTIGLERSGTAAALSLFLIWRLAKPGFRLVRCLMGQDVLPFSLLIRMLLSTYAGLGSYTHSRKQIRNIVREAGDRPKTITA